MITLAAIVAILAGIGFWFYRMGKKSQRERDISETLNTVKERNAISDDVKKLDDDELDRRLSKWMRK